MQILSHRNLSGRRLGQALIGVFSVAVIILLVAYPRHGDGRGAQMAAVIIQMAIFKTALDAFKMDTGAYPSGTNSLEALVRPPQGTTNWHGPYMEEIPLDPWGHEYIYTCPGSHVAFGYPSDLFSQGAAKQKRPVANWMQPALKPL
jgi:general secretion pathway protein G